MVQRKWTDDDLAAAIAASRTIADALRLMGLSVSPGNYKTVAKYVKLLGLSTDHHTGKAHGTSITPQKQPLESILVQGSTYNTSHLRKRLIKEGLLEEGCAECSLGPEWRGRPLTLQLDHVNGDPSDNRLENLRLLCPNCHTQTKNFTGRNIRGRYRKAVRRCECGTPISKTSEACNRCRGLRASKITWPPADKLALDVARSSYTDVAKELGVSDNAIRKYLRKQLGFCPKKRREG